MNRKVLTAGRSSLAVSLPRSFVNQHGLEPGMEVQIMHKGTELVVSCEDPAQIELEISLADFKSYGHGNIDRFADKLLGACYKQGADVIILQDVPDRFAQAVRKIIDAGKLDLFEEPSVEPGSIVIRCPVAKMDDDALYGLTRSIIQAIYKNIQFLQEYLQTDDAALLGEIQKQETIINRKTDLSRRLANKNIGSKHSVAQYTFSDKLEKIGDEIYRLSRSLNDKYEHLTEFLEQIASLVFKIQQLFERYSFTLASDFQDELQRLGGSLSSDNRKGNELRPLVFLLDSTFSDLLMLR